MQNIIIRPETKSDHRAVEELTRKAFWNTNVPGADEHYLVHIMRDHADFIPQLDLVLEVDGEIAANIMYARSTLVDDDGGEKQVLTFGPLSVLPECQRRGYGKRLLARSFEIAEGMGFDTVVIFGNPENYISSGFKSCKKFNVTIDGESFPVALLVRELKSDALDGRKWTYKESPVYDVDPEAAAEFDKGFEPAEKGYKPGQELFYIYSRSQIVR